MAIDFYHNPRCATSRKALGLLRAKGVEPNIIEYLKSPPSRARLRELAKLMGLHPRDMLRKREKAALAAARIDPKAASADAAIEAMAADPILIERPIVVNGKTARLGRPPEAVLEVI